MLPSGLEGEVRRGRCYGRDTAYADLLNTAELRAGIQPTPNPVTGEIIPITTASIHELEHAVTITDISPSQLRLTNPPNGALTECSRVRLTRQNERP